MAVKIEKRHQYLCTVHWAMLKTGATVVRRGPMVDHKCEYEGCYLSAFVQVY